MKPIKYNDNDDNCSPHIMLLLLFQWGKAKIGLPH